MLAIAFNHIAAALVLTQAVAAPGQAPTEKRVHLDRARALYGDLHYAEVLPELEAALAQPGNDPATLIEIYALLGTVQVVLDNGEAARAAFENVLKLAPEYQLDARLSPKIRDFFAEVRRTATPLTSIRFTGPARVSADSGNAVAVEVELEQPAPAGLTVELWARGDRSAPYRAQPMQQQGPQRFRCEVAAPADGGGAVDYYLVALDALGRVAGTMGSVAAPLSTGERNDAWFAQPGLWVAVGVTAAMVAAAAAVTAVVLLSSDSSAEQMSLGTHTLD